MSDVLWMAAPTQIRQPESKLSQNADPVPFEREIIERYTYFTFLYVMTIASFPSKYNIHR